MKRVRAVIPFALLALAAGCSDKTPNDLPAGAKNGVALDPYIACVGKAHSALGLPKDTLFAWGTHREDDAGLVEPGLSSKQKIIETWFVIPHDIGPPDSRSLRCVVERQDNGTWVTKEITTEKEISPGLGQKQ